eukprot:10731592-Heterocapsa_arctica.AAC.1
MEDDARPSPVKAQQPVNDQHLRRRLLQPATDVADGVARVDHDVDKGAVLKPHAHLKVRLLREDRFDDAVDDLT